MDRTIDSQHRADQSQIKVVDEVTKFVDELNLPHTAELKSIEDINCVAKLCDLVGKNLISEVEFTKLMEQVRKDKVVFEEAYTKDRIKHQVQDFQGMLNVFSEGSQSFLTTKDAISKLISML